MIWIDFKEWLIENTHDIHLQTGLSGSLWAGMIFEEGWEQEYCEDRFWFASQEYLEMTESQRQVIKAKSIHKLHSMWKDAERGLHVVRNTARPDFGPDNPLVEFLDQFPTKRMLHIYTEIARRSYVLHLIRQYAERNNLTFLIVDMSNATISDIVGSEETLEVGGKEYRRRELPNYWPKEPSMIVVIGMEENANGDMWNAFDYVAMKPKQNMVFLYRDKLPEGSGFVFFSTGSVPTALISVIWGADEYQMDSIEWPPPMYSKERTIYETRIAFQQIGQLYRKSFLNRRTKTRGSDPEYFTEVIAGELLEQNVLSAFKVEYNNPFRKTSTVFCNHSSAMGRDRSITGRAEKRLLSKIKQYATKGYTLGPLGQVLDCRVPVIARNFERGPKVDILSIEKNMIWLSKLKDSSSKDTLLSSILEIATAFHMLDRTKLKPKLKTLPIPDVFRKALIVFEQSLQHEELLEMAGGIRPNLLILAEHLDVSFFLIAEKRGRYYVSEFLLPESKHNTLLESQQCM